MAEVTTKEFFNPIKDTKENIKNYPLVPGQILFETDQGLKGKIYVDTYESYDTTTGEPIGELKRLSFAGDPVELKVLKFEENDEGVMAPSFDYYNFSLEDGVFGKTSEPVLEETISEPVLLKYDVDSVNRIAENSSSAVTGDDVYYYVEDALTSSIYGFRETIQTEMSDFETYIEMELLDLYELQDLYDDFENLYEDDITEVLLRFEDITNNFDIDNFILKESVDPQTVPSDINFTGAIKKNNSSLVNKTELDTATEAIQNYFDYFTKDPTADPAEIYPSSEGSYPVMESDSVTVHEIENGTVTAGTGHSLLRFGVDSDGNYGYIKPGADSVTPFKSGSDDDLLISIKGIDVDYYNENLFDYDNYTQTAEMIDGGNYTIVKNIDEYSFSAKDSLDWVSYNYHTDYDTTNSAGGHTLRTTCEYEENSSRSQSISLSDNNKFYNKAIYLGSNEKELKNLDIAFIKQYVDSEAVSTSKKENFLEIKKINYWSYKDYLTSGDFSKIKCFLYINNSSYESNLAMSDYECRINDNILTLVFDYRTLPSDSTSFIYSGSLFRCDLFIEPKAIFDTYFISSSARIFSDMNSTSSLSSSSSLDLNAIRKTEIPSKSNFNIYNFLNTTGNVPIQKAFGSISTLGGDGSKILMSNTDMLFLSFYWTPGTVTSVGVRTMHTVYSNTPYRTTIIFDKLFLENGYTEDGQSKSDPLYNN